MAATTMASSVIREIAELGGEVIAKGLSKEHFHKLTQRYPELFLTDNYQGRMSFRDFPRLFRSLDCSERSNGVTHPGPIQ